MKQVKKKLHAEWEVISSAEWLEKLDRNPTNEEMLQIFAGNFYPLFHVNRVNNKQVWTLKITTYLECDDGCTSECELEWKFDKPMSMHEVLNGAKHIKVDQGGIKTRWGGVTKNWIRELDTDYDDTWKATKAIARAECTAMVKQVNGAAHLLNSLIGHLEKVA